ncbi:MAG: hypothetical protein OEL89_03770, partial [Candidatus Peregrinibacteria bacterium]|nr:hypothetical protein [Candidatus Peregrinibacteria bacterium]
HVVRKNNGDPADFCLLCLAGTKSSRTVNCDIAASVISIHENYDAALIKPLNKTIFLPPIKRSRLNAMIGSQIRIEGFPTPIKGVQNFGSTKTYDNILKWTKNGGKLTTGGDKLTITRGKIKKIGIMQPSNSLHYLTNVKVNFGTSGGAAFDENRNFVGLPTLRDRNFNALILAFDQLEDWIAKKKKTKAKVSNKIYNYYKKKLRQPQIMANRKKQIKKKLKSNSLATNIFKTKNSKTTRYRKTRNFREKRTNVKSSIKSRILRLRNRTSKNNYLRSQK